MATHVPAELLRKEPVPTRVVATNSDVALLIIDYDEALSRANEKIGAIATIINGAPR